MCVKSLAGLNALVLGATRGIGRDIALTFAGDGANVILPYYDWPQACRETIQQFQALPGHHLVVKTDLRDPNQIKELCRQIDNDYGRLDILINNIERGGMPIVHGSYTPEQWDLEMDTTLKAKWWVFQEAMPLLKKSKQAAVVNISSIAGEPGRAGPAGMIFNEAYAAANRAVSSFTETWARQAAPVRVNELMLGFIESRHAQGTRGWDLLTEEARQEIISHTLLQRTGRRQEVTRAVLFLVKDATFMTGAAIRLDGGYCLGHDQTSAMPPGVENLAITL
ncbi:MAG: SDR family oxidoreductase [Deltaproteobacteria bacterium]|nr:SDR family oxidoreductase [Deltaproteobacteria bacterium]